MATIRQEIPIDAAPGRVWDAVRDIGAVHRRLVPGYTAATRIDGHIRTLTMANGAVVRERIVTVDDDARRLAYAVIAGRLPLEHHHASLQVLDAGDGRALLVWITDLLPDRLAPEARAHIERGAAVMQRALEADAANY